MAEAPIIEFRDDSRYSNKRSAKEWKLFVSSKVSHVVTDVKVPSLKYVDDEEVAEQEFRAIFREVDKLATQQYAWKDRKKMEAEKLVALGSKPAKNIKRPPDMGRGMKRKREQIEEQKRQEDLAAGLHRPKLRKNVDNKDKGLRLSEGRFKGGVLYVSPITNVKQEPRGGILGNIFRAESSSRQKQGKKSKGKKKKKKKKGKRR